LQSYNAANCDCRWDATGELSSVYPDLFTSFNRKGRERMKRKGEGGSAEGGERGMGRGGQGREVVFERQLEQGLC